MRDVTFLHVAPEYCYKEKFKNRFMNYLTADINDSSVMLKMDITKIEYPNDSFDIIFCNHVLEHIPEDGKAMAELYRVLKKDGLAILLVPLSSNFNTYEDWSITTPEGRLEAFWQDDHVRLYGQDYFEKLRAVGFIVSTICDNEYLSQKEIKKYIGSYYDVIIQCTK
jgi:ubiquinone/menaquinone biosynthesis C-methylase UbiE